MEFKNKKIIIIATIVAIALGTITYNVTKKEEYFEEFNIESTPEVVESNLEENDSKIVVHITGSIVNPGIITADAGSRVIDIIEKAGGVTNDADISKINLAYKVQDEEKIYVPNINDEDTTNYLTNNNVQGKIKININTATQTELETLPGVGPSLALSIVNYRKENGKFKRIEDIKKVNGIGDAKYNNIKDLINI
jgi:competence protein ComEA